MPITSGSLKKKSGSEMSATSSPKGVQTSSMGQSGMIKKKSPTTGGMIGPGGFDFSTIRKAPPGYVSTKFPDLVVPEETLEDSNPISTEGRITKDLDTGTASDTGVTGLWSGLVSILPTLLIIGAVVIGGSILLKSGKKGGGRK